MSYSKLAWAPMPSGFITPENNQYNVLRSPTPTNIRDNIISDTKSPEATFRFFIYRENIFISDNVMSRHLKELASSNYLSLIDLLPVLERFMELMNGCSAFRWFRQQVYSNYISTQGLNYLKYITSDKLSYYEVVYNKSFIHANNNDVSNVSREEYVKHITKTLASSGEMQWSSFFARLVQKDPSGKFIYEFLKVIFDPRI